MPHFLKQIIQIHHLKNQSSKVKKKFFSTENTVEEHVDYNSLNAKKKIRKII